MKITYGSDSPERCAQGFTVAATAALSGVPVSVWLVGEASWFALPGRAEQFELPHAAPLPELLTAVLDSGQLTLCSQCAARRGISEVDVLDGVRIAGAATFVTEVMSEGAKSLVY